MRRTLLVFMAWAALAAPSPAQWSSDPSANTAVAAKDGDQAVPKLAVAADGGSYVGWFDHAGANYDLFLQRFDVHGFASWPAGGIAISTHPQLSSLVDWDLIADASGGAVLVFTDARAGGDLDVYAYRIDAAGQFLWGPDGVTLSANGDYEPSPTCAEASNGEFVFVWSRLPSGADGRLVMQRLDGAGNKLLGLAGLTLPGVAGEDPAFPDLDPSDGGAVVLSWISDIGSFSSFRRLRAQKFGPTGAALWPGSYVSVYDAVPLPIGYGPELQDDGAGGAWFAWHAAQGDFRAFVQHVDASGIELFAHNGVEVSTEAGKIELNPDLAQVPGTGDVIVAYAEQNPPQSQWGISAQRVTAGGALAWGASGIQLAAYDSVVEELPLAVPCDGGAIVLWELGQTSTSFQTEIVALRLDSFGNSVWGGGMLDACSVVSPKDDIRALASNSDGALLAWQDDRGSSPDIYAQNLRADGTLGLLPALAAPYGCGLNPAGSLALSRAPLIGTTPSFEISDPSLTMGAGDLTFLALAFAPAAGFPCGVPIAGWGLGGPLGELLVDPSALLPVSVGPALPGAGLPAAIPLSIPADPALVEATVFAQAAILDLGSAALGLTEALSVRFGV